jgi:hypothetical protein
MLITVESLHYRQLLTLVLTLASDTVYSVISRIVIYSRG